MTAPDNEAPPPRPPADAARPGPVELTVDDLRVLGVFAGASDDELAALIQHGRPISVPAGTVLMTEAHDAHSAALVISGRLNVVRGGETVAQLSAGDAAGELGLVRQSKRTATVVADAESVLLAYDKAGFQQILDIAPTIAMTVLRQMRERPQEGPGGDGPEGGSAEA